MSPRDESAHRGRRIPSRVIKNHQRWLMIFLFKSLGVERWILKMNRRDNTKPTYQIWYTCTKFDKWKIIQK